MADDVDYSDPNGPTREKAQLGLPERWLKCPRLGQVIEIVDKCSVKFIPFKTPLCRLYDDQIPEAYRFTPQMIFDNGGRIGKIGLWIDLTKTNRYYSRIEVERNECVYRKLPLEGHDAPPNETQTNEFIQTDHTRRNQLVAVHCTHGFNRTGFLIAAYLCEIFEWSVEAAVKKIADARPPGIYKHDYIRELFRIYGDIDDTPTAPIRPSWCFESNDDVLAATIDNDATTTASSSSGKKPIFMDGAVPAVKYVEDAAERSRVQKLAQKMCDYRKNGFPGSQPVSLEASPVRNNLAYLGQHRYRVSWKADGVRYMLLIEDQNRIFAFDRDHNAFSIPNLSFLNRKENRHMRNTLVDGEMIIDKVKESNGHERLIPRYLIYDIIKFEGIDVGKSNFDVRMDCIRREIIEPRTEAIKKLLIDKSKEPMGVRRKDFWDVSMVEKLFADSFQKTLPHEIDGLVFQPVDTTYESGRCDTVLKWKPANLNSVDFKLHIVRECRTGMLAETKGLLYVQHYTEPMAEIRITKELKQYDKKIIECTYANGQWKFLRVRTDKSLPNAYATAMAVCNSIRYPISKEALIEYIRTHPYTVGSSSNNRKRAAPSNDTESSSNT